TRFQSQATAELAHGAPKLHVVTFGCQMNKYDSLLVEGRFAKQGYATTENMDEADVVLFNTCSVREHAEERTWSWLGELKRAKETRPELVIGVMGCMAQRVEEEVFRRAGHVDIVVGTRRFQHLPEMVAELRAKRAEGGRKMARLLDTGSDGGVEVDRATEDWVGGNHGFLAVMRGCDLNCTYCIVPTTRGRVRSRSIEDLVREARWMVERGVQVITLLGQTVNSYGEDFQKPGPGDAKGTGRQGRPSLGDLMRELQEIDGLKRIRLITLHPSYVTPSFAQAIADCDKVERALPLPMQSGSDRILKAMKRGYTKELYLERVAMLREAVPDIELGSDWIVGFPGETEEDFEQSVQGLKEVGFLTNYVFKYDPRPETRSAEGMVDDIPDSVKKERNQRLLAASEEVSLGRLKALIGSDVTVLAEDVSERVEGNLVGKTRGGVSVHFGGGAELIGSEISVNVERATAYGLGGSLLET
ncbi:MAG: tRNA (N6-isopentenyl adenosine(37)-C2)-methylthiotransferase MiaB, partial [Planctomycetota bacterium]|nr:tRNA (N6-isopentenyl adenosine(37)-C2)-methylthiotransferase MiaB [Planctomycetota bacterium]